MQLNATEFETLQSKMLSHMARTLYVFYLQPLATKQDVVIDLVHLSAELISNSPIAPCHPDLREVEAALFELENAGLILRVQENAPWESAEICFPLYAKGGEELPLRPFRMYVGWQPGPNFRFAALQAGLTNRNYRNSELLEFVNYWCSRPTERNQHAWELAFVRRLIQLNTAAISNPRNRLRPRYDNLAPNQSTSTNSDNWLDDFEDEDDIAALHASYPTAQSAHYLTTQEAANRYAASQEHAALHQSLNSNGPTPLALPQSSSTSSYAPWLQQMHPPKEQQYQPLSQSYSNTTAQGQQSREWQAPQQPQSQRPQAQAYMAPQSYPYGGGASGATLASNSSEYGYRAVPADRGQAPVQGHPSSLSDTDRAPSSGPQANSRAYPAPAPAPSSHQGHSGGMVGSVASAAMAAAATASTLSKPRDGNAGGYVYSGGSFAVSASTSAATHAEQRYAQPTAYRELRPKLSSIYTGKAEFESIARGYSDPTLHRKDDLSLSGNLPTAIASNYTDPRLHENNNPAYSGRMLQGTASGYRLTQNYTPQENTEGSSNSIGAAFGRMDLRAFVSGQGEQPQQQQAPAKLQAQSQEQSLPPAQSSQQNITQSATLPPQARSQTAPPQRAQSHEPPVSLELEEDVEDYYS